MKDLKRFLDAQERDYETALKEIQAGHKQSHWIWYIFPQLEGLGYSSMAVYYGIENLEEAKEYLAHPVLRARLLEISEALLHLGKKNPTEVMGYPDDMKLRSCMTLFMLAAPDEPVFRAVLDRYFEGKPDEKTIELVKG
ncbi:MAG: DUF1810 domain-containing protein [Clostridia bacterium]|nr:DUF1810 domain-containing protein [Clostridia bacterium]